MDRNAAARVPCAVCGIEETRHQGWFLVSENQWLDRIKVLAWHPVLARQASMQSICGEEHLKTLLTHWLTHANLRILATASMERAVRQEPNAAEADPLRSVGRVLGELAVHRESLSHVWTGSPETLECILRALVQGAGSESRASAFPQRGLAAPILQDYTVPNELVGI